MHAKRERADESTVVIKIPHFFHSLFWYMNAEEFNLIWYDDKYKRKSKMKLA